MDKSIKLIVVLYISNSIIINYKNDFTKKNGINKKIAFLKIFL